VRVGEAEEESCRVVDKVGAMALTLVVEEGVRKREEVVDALMGMKFSDSTPSCCCS
jgi:hypothetical protein